MAVQEEPHQLHGSAEIRVATRVLQIAKYIVTSLKAQRGWSNPALHEREAASVSHEAQPELMRGTFENHHMDTDWKLSKQDHRYRKHNSDAYRVRKACPKKSSVMTKSKVSRINKIEWEDNTTVDGSLFASGQVNPDWSSLTWVELARLLVFIYDALATLQMNLGSNDRLVSSGDEVVHSHNVHADLSYVAKMEYLLLHYRDSMIEALIRKTVELVASMRWQKLQRSLRQELDWQCRRYCSRQVNANASRYVGCSLTDRMNNSPTQTRHRPSLFT
ncbi:hypothetical protein EJ05DRAFT_471733 [Pseudovirgaria hyperparasitica]|uniref:Uncharacterized protein n=1 Tax=Pseudovirgaria hyperparasitica TaxID=470096 RepID=A0A6A6WKT0_9PEZI|nr:uncharacterized protein EJ05DRAFT_471733 [Pseudovirgaria hyperparasitica]KAF2762776.1 hypothetical protein EJ05DRAFT_471733 [Pseudovirgaria hyperparasitica]